jgi:ligand-binding SRPBCC domain-containing protein
MYSYGKRKMAKALKNLPSSEPITMKLFHLNSKVFIPKPLQDVFPFFADATNLQQITPPWLNFRVVTAKPIEMKPGQMIDYRIRVRGFSMKWRSEITVWEPPYRFVDEQIRGPYKVWHHEHIFTEQDGQTICEDKVDYAVLGGSLINRFFVEPDVRRIFEYRRSRIREIFGFAD